MRYAAKTAISCEKSRAEIERVLCRYGASGFAYGWEGSAAMIGFRAFSRHVKFVLRLPDRGEKRFHQTASRRTRRNLAAAMAHWEQACRQSWRALALVIKAKLEAVESGITSFDEEFLAHIVLPNGQTAGQMALPAIADSYATGRTVKLLPWLETGSETGERKKGEMIDAMHSIS